MKDLKVTAKMFHEVYISPKDAFELIKNSLFYEDRDSFICVQDGELKRGTDISYHGSPYYEYETISNNPKWIELFNSVKCLNNYFLNSDSHEWDKMIECNEEIDEENEPTMSM